MLRFSFFKFKVLLITWYNAMLLRSAETDSAGSPHWIVWGPHHLRQGDVLTVLTGGPRQLRDAQHGRA